MSQTQLDLAQQVAINLPLGAWNTVLNLIAKGPWDVADPLMQVMRAQIAAATQPKPTPTAGVRPRVVTEAPTPPPPMPGLEAG